jgi:mRNA interferase MazF
MPGKCVTGSVIEVNLHPCLGSEPRKTRPCLVIQSDIGNKFPVDVPVCKGEGGLTKDSAVQRSRGHWVNSTLGQMKKIDRALRISMALDSE